MELKDRIKFILKNEGVSQRELAGILNISAQSITNWMNRGSISKTGAEQISKLYGYPIEWILSGSGDYLVDNGLNEKKSNFYKIEVLDITASAGKGYINSDLVETVKVIEYENNQALKMFNGIPASDLKIINIKGDSMQGTFECGDAIYVDVTQRKFDGDGIYVFTFENSLFVKRLQIVRGSIIVLSDNKLYEKWAIEPQEIDQLYIHGKVLLSQSMELRKHG